MTTLNDMRLPSLKDKILEKEALALKPKKVKKEKKTAGREPKKVEKTKKSKKK